MNKKYITIAAAVAFVAAGAITPYCFSQSNAGAPAAEPTTVPAPPVSTEQAKKAFSYFAGYRFGQEISQGISTLTVEDFDRDTFFRALETSLNGAQPTEEEQRQMEAGMQAFVDAIQQREKALGELNLSKGKAFQESFGKQEGVSKTESGLQYRILTKGEGRTYDEQTDGAAATALVTYEGKLIDGKTFDKSETPVPMPINQVVPGFSEALKLMPIGSEWEICIPSDLGYGDQSTGPIGANSTLVFTIKLHDITKGAAGGMNLPDDILKQLQAQGLEMPAAPAEEAPAPAEEAPAPAEDAPAPAEEAPAPTEEAPAPAEEAPAPAEEAPAPAEEAPAPAEEAPAPAEA
ncbi:MAG: FKBP-type peptidyl-prolyl cis-trans isomerase N-terminal domain-containing protein [Akkermansia sp.]